MPRSLVLQLQVSADMYMSTPEKTLSFLGTQWSEDLSTYIASFMEPVDSILMGHNLAAGFISHWLNRPAHESAATIDKINSCHKTIFSWRITKPDQSWVSSDGGKVEVVNGDLATEVTRIKNEEGGKLIAYGGVQFVQALMAVHGLVDELLLVVNPTALGRGECVFQTNSKWNLQEVQKFDCGLAILNWRAGTA